MSIPPLLTDSTWQMPFGERAALEGLLAAMKPRLSIEIGTAEGGSLRRIAAHSEETHAIDLDLSRVAAPEAPGLHLHEGDSHGLLEGLLGEFARDGRQVDFALIDGDHSRSGARADVAAFLSSPAAQGAIILLHDTAHPDVRAGILDAVGEAGSATLSVNLDFIPGMLSLQPPSLGPWAGLGLLVVGAEVPIWITGFNSAELLAAEWELRQAGEIPGEGRESVLLAKLERQRSWLAAMRESPSWRMTAPLRALKEAGRTFRRKAG